MTVYAYGVEHADVTKELPGIDPSGIGSTGEPLNTTDITGWITDGAGQVNALLDRSGITPSVDLDEDTHCKLAAAVKDYAIHKSMLVLGVTGPLLDAVRDRFNATYAEISNRPQMLGAAYGDGLTTTTDTVTTTDRWSFIDNEGSNW